MGQDVSCCRSTTPEEGFNGIFEMKDTPISNNFLLENNQIHEQKNLLLSSSMMPRDEPMLLCPGYVSPPPVKNKKFIKLQKVSCDWEQVLAGNQAQISLIDQAVSPTCASWQAQTDPYQNSQQLSYNKEVKISKLNENNQGQSSYSLSGAKDGSRFLLDNYSFHNGLQGSMLETTASKSFNQVSSNGSYFQSFSSGPIEAPTRVREYYPDGSSYCGTKVNDLRQGQGTFNFINKSRYDGQWFNDEMSGKGNLYYPSGRLAYSGEFRNNKFHGMGCLWNDQVDFDLKNDDLDYFKNCNTIGQKWTKYQGEFLNDQKNGKGTLFFSNGHAIKANYLDERINGECVVVNSSNSEIFKGYWSNNLLQQQLI